MLSIYPSPPRAPSSPAEMRSPIRQSPATAAARALGAAGTYCLLPDTLGQDRNPERSYAGSGGRGAGQGSVCWCGSGRQGAAFRGYLGRGPPIYISVCKELSDFRLEIAGKGMEGFEQPRKRCWWLVEEVGGCIESGE